MNPKKVPDPFLALSAKDRAALKKKKRAKDRYKNYVENIARSCINHVVNDPEKKYG